MSDIGSKPSHFEDALSAALRRLARSAPRNAPPELAAGLVQAFRRHHLRRKIIRSTLVFSIFLAAGAVLFWVKTIGPTTRVLSGGGRQPTIAGRANVSASDQKQNYPTQDGVRQAGEDRQLLKLAGKPAGPARKRRSLAAKSSSAPTPNAAARERFVALPSFAFRVPGEELRVIRVNMPISSLRLLGVQVRGEVTNRRITTDLVIGTDGTPYAFRPIT